MSDKTDNNSFTKQDHTEELLATSGIKSRKKRKMITYSIIAVLLICIGIGSVLIFSSGIDVFSSNTQVTVTFDSTGGSEIESQTVPKGEKLTEVGTPSRNGSVFLGWYYEEAPVNAYSEDDVFSEDTTLYAGWYEPEMEVDKAEYIKDCDSNLSFVVHSEAALTPDNLADYIDFSVSGIEDGKTLSVKQQDEGYLLYSENGFTPGNTYSIEILDTKTVSFVKAGEENVSGLGITSYNFTVYRENANNVVKKVEPKLLSSDDISDLVTAGEVADGETGNENDNGKTIYRAALVNEEGDYQVGDIMSLGNGEEDTAENQYYKVVKVTKNKTGIYLDLILPNMDEIYSELDIYYSGDAVGFEEDKEIDKDEIERSLQTSLKNSPGYDYVCTAVAKSIKASPTLLKTVKGLDINSQKRFENISIGTLKDLLKSVKFNVEIGSTIDDVGKTNGCYGKINFTTGDIKLKLDDNVTLTIKLSMAEDITTTIYGWTKLDEWKIYTDQGAHLKNVFTTKFSAVISTSSGTTNISDELQKLIDSQSNDKTADIVNDMNNENFFKDLDYVKILSKRLGEKTVTIYEILSIQFTLDFNVSLGARAGLDLDFSSTEVRRIGMYNLDYSSGEKKRTQMKSYNTRLYTEINFSATLKGQIGIRAGFEAGVNFSVLHLNDVFNFGFSAEIGAYEEISGYLRFDYNYKKTTDDESSNMSLAGGLKSETGIYLSLGFTWNTFGWKGNVIIAEMKFPILTIGALEFASEFKEPISAATFNTTSYNIKNSGDANLLALKYIDISGGANGVTINVKPAPLSDDYLFYSIQDQTGKGGKDDLKYVHVNPDNGMVTIADNAPDRLDFTVAVQYKKGCSLFTEKLTPMTKQINLTYMKYKVNDSTKKYTATFYLPDESVIEQKQYYVGQVPVPPAEDTYEEKFIYAKYKIRDWSKPWKEGFKAIYEDTAYNLDCELNYKNINFYGEVYNETSGQYQYGLIATVPTLCGDMPMPPSLEDTDVPGWEFLGWSPELSKVQNDSNYTAMYRQDPNYCFCNFYANGNRILYGLVKIGDTPVAPDMSQYNTDDQKFAGWWPSLGPTSDDYQTYTAVFRKYVIVTFKDMDGKGSQKNGFWREKHPKHRRRRMSLKAKRIITSTISSTGKPRMGRKLIRCTKTPSIRRYMISIILK